MRSQFSASVRQTRSAAKVARKASSNKMIKLAGVAFLMLVVVSEGLRLIVQSL